MTDGLNNKLLVRYSGHGLNSECLVQYSGHGLNNGHLNSEQVKVRYFPYSHVPYSDPHCSLLYEQVKLLIGSNLINRHVADFFQLDVDNVLLFHFFDCS